MDVFALRAREFPSIGESVYLNAASVAPIPERARLEVERFNARRSSIHLLQEADLTAPLVRSREAAARLVGASPDEIALGGNTSFGINLVAMGLPLEQRRTVVVSDGEFPANVYPWMAMSGATLEVVPTDGRGLPDEERLLERLDGGDVGVFALSAVQFATGYLADVGRFGRFCRERGIVFVVDAIQSLGQVPMDVERCCVDVLATGGHKWLCSPFGSGFAYVRRELHSRLQPRAIGWTSMTASDDFGALTDYRWELRDGARRYEVATPGFQDFVGFSEAVELLLEVGVERIRSHQADITRPLVTWLEQHEAGLQSDLSPERRSGIVTFAPPDPPTVFAALTRAGVVCALREGAIRLAAHLYNTREEMERVVDVLDSWRAR